MTVFTVNHNYAYVRNNNITILNDKLMIKNKLEFTFTRSVEQLMYNSINSNNIIYIKFV